MKTKITCSILLLLSVYISGNAQHTTITTTSKEVSRNLDLKAVAYIFGESYNLANFEKQLNNPDLALSNLDLNRDGYVDYLRVVESNMQNAHLVNIQAVLGNDLYKDVATIGIQKDKYGKSHVRMIGNEHLYGQNYIINPVYANQPLLIASFWNPKHISYNVSYYKHYPVYYKPRIVCSTPVYHRHINYYTTSYYNTNNHKANYHHAYKPHYTKNHDERNHLYSNTSHSNKYANNSTSHTYGEQHKNSHTKANNKQSNTTTTKQHTRQNKSTARYANNTNRQVSTGNYNQHQTRATTYSRPSNRTTEHTYNTNRPESTSRKVATVRTASNHRSSPSTRTTQSKSSREELAMK